MGKELEKTFFQIIHTYDQQVFGTLINITNNTFNNVKFSISVYSVFKVYIYAYNCVYI